MNSVRLGASTAALFGGAAYAALAPAQPAIPFKRDAAASALPLGGGAAGVLLLSLLAIGVVLVVRKRLRLGASGAGQTPLVRVLETQRLGPRALLSVVEFSGTHYLIAQGEHGINCVASVPLKEPA